MNGYIKLPRSYFESPKYPANLTRPLTTAEAEVDLRALANIGTSILKDGRIIKRGQLTRSTPFFMKQWKWGRTRVETFLRQLTVSGTVNVTTQRGMSNIITIYNYDCLPVDLNGNIVDNQPTDQPTTESSGSATIEEEEEEKERASVKKKTKEPSFFAADSPESQLVDFCIDKIKNNHPGVKFDTRRKQQIALMFSDMVRIDKISLSKAKEMIVWVTGHDDQRTHFSWADQFMSPLKMRKSNKDGIRFSTMWERAMSKEKGLLGGRPANMTAVEWDRVRDMPPCDNCKTKEHMKIMSKAGRMSKWYCQKCNIAKTVVRS